MRGKATAQQTLLMVGSVEERIPKRHPIRRIKTLTDEALVSMSEVFEEMYARVGRPSVPPERLLKAQLLMALFSVRSDRQFCEQLEYNLLFRWFLDLQLDEPSFDASTFSHNRKRLIDHEAAQHLLAAIVAQARGRNLLSEEHFSVDGTLIEAWASMKSFRPKDEPPSSGDSNGWSDFRGQKRSNDTHASTTDPDAKMFRKGRGHEAKLRYCGNVLMENRSGLLVDVDIALADGYGERDGAARMLARLPRRKRTLGADKGYDTKGFVRACRKLCVTPHVTQNAYDGRSSAIDRRTTRHAGYEISQKIRRAIEKSFGWLKDYGGWRKTRFRGLQRVALDAHLSVAAYDLLRIARLIGEPSPG
jgi:transposase